MTNAVVYVPEYAGTFDKWMFNSQLKLKTIMLYAPKVTRINEGMFNGCSALVADASEWRLDSVEIIKSLVRRSPAVRSTRFYAVRQIGRW